MRISFIMAQVMGIGALIFLIYSFQNNNKKTLLSFQIISSFLYAMQYLFLGAYTGFLMNMVCMVRNYLFKEYDEIDVSLRWLLIIISAISLLTMFSFNGYASLLPFFAVFFFTVFLWVGNLKLIRFFEALGAVLFIFYSIIVHAYTGIFAFAFELSTVLFAIYRFDIKKDSKKKG